MSYYMHLIEYFFEKLLMGYVIICDWVFNIYYFIDIVNTDHCTDTDGINFSCTPSI